MIILNQSETKKLHSKITEIFKNSESEFQQASLIARQILGCQILKSNLTQLGFYVPAVGDASKLELEFLTPDETIPFFSIPKKGQTYSFSKSIVPIQTHGDYVFGIYEGVKVGSKDQTGALYTLLYTDSKGNVRRIKDPLALSMPLGVTAPPEIYNIQDMLDRRKDLDYFTSFYKTIYPDGSYRARDLGSTLEIHIQTATTEGTLAALTRLYRKIAEKIQTNLKEARDDPYSELSAYEMNFIGYDTIELMPEVPQAERYTRENGEFFVIQKDSGKKLNVQVKRPDIQGWGYDVVIYGTGAVNPSLLETGRPDEFLEFIETIHTMPHKPIGLCLDSVLGHADFQGGQLLATYETKSESKGLKYINSLYLKGSNMYGRDVNYGHPVIRAILLEMFRRKNNFGVDAIRVDGGQDFVKDIDEVTGLKIQDDEFLHAMSTVVQEIGDIKRRLDINIEDGRPWPDDTNWIYNSTYLCHVTDRHLPFDDRTKQWSPLIFAHNVHAKFKWFYTKWDKFKDVFKEGEHWITGNSTHDNARYFYRMVSPVPGSTYQPGSAFDDYYNDYLGPTLTEAAHNALDNPALSAINLGILPGSPMFFLNSTFHTPWLFFRDVEDEFDLKVVADEGSRFLLWYINEELYTQPQFFTRLKALGFTSLSKLIQKNSKDGFLDILYNKLQDIKTDSTIVSYLYDDPLEHGGFDDASILANYTGELKNSTGKLDHRTSLQKIIDRDPIESHRRLNAAKTYLLKAKQQISKEMDHHGSMVRRQLEKIDYLWDLSFTDKEALQLLLEDSALKGSYDPKSWSRDSQIRAVTPAQLSGKEGLTGSKLSKFAKSFMFDALEICNIDNFADNLDPEQARYNLTLRTFRNKHPWLALNPTNDIRRDFFNRNLVANGAKHTGGWSDRGDIINANTIYYGWRTNPEKTKQIFLIANMEGKELEKLSLRFLMITEEKWKVVVQSPGLNVPPEIDRYYVLENFVNGQALVLERDL